MNQENETTSYGDEEGFHLTVCPAFGDGDLYEITIWRRNHGIGGFPEIADRAKAERVAGFLYEELLPEYNKQVRRQEESMEKFDAEMAKRPKPNPLKVSKNAPKVKVLLCPECQELVLPENVSDERVYECNACGTTETGDDGRRCEQCNKFAAKISDTSCPECGAAMDDAEKVEAQRATIGTLVQVEQPS